MSWLELLENACAKNSQADVGRALGYSSTVINQVLKGKYPGNMDRLASRVERVYGQEKTTICPVLGEISNEDCLGHQRAKFSSSNPFKVRLFRACKRCPNAEGNDHE